MVLIKDGYIHIYYCFDIGYEIALEKLEKLLGKKPKEAQLACTKLAPGYIRFASPPYKVALGRRKIAFNGLTVEAECSGKLYDFGVITITLTWPISGDLRAVAELSDKIVGNAEVAKAAHNLAERIWHEIRELVSNPIEPVHWTSESYLIIYAKELDERLDAKALLQRHGNEIAAIVAVEPTGLSVEERTDALKGAISYYADDLVVIDWSAAFVLDPRPCEDTLNVLEYALIQLLELRSYDNLLDKAIGSAYDEIEKMPYPKFLFASRAALMGRLLTLRLDVSETVEKVLNTLKPIGDLYLARIYSIAQARFHLQAWQASLLHKLGVIERTYEALATELASSRMIFLEALIVALIVVEIALFFLH